jgi:hypothetical protein
MPAIVGDTTVVVHFTTKGEVKDIEGPRIDQLSIEPDLIDTSTSDQTVGLKAHITDDLSGFAEGSIVFTSPSGEQSVKGSVVERTSGTADEGEYEISIAFPQLCEMGTWKISSIRLLDTAGNETMLSQGAIEKLGLQHELLVKGRLPTITGISPGYGPESGGTEIHISGSDFTQSSEIYFGSIRAREVVVDSPTAITAIAPPGSGTVDVTVTTENGISMTSSIDRFRYSAALSLTSTPNPLIHGQKVTLTAALVSEASGAPAPVGSVSFLEGSNSLGVVELHKGVATLKTKLAAGPHLIVAKYVGDSYYGPAESNQVLETVER